MNTNTNTNTDTVTVTNTTVRDFFGFCVEIGSFIVWLGLNGAVIYGACIQLSHMHFIH